MKSLGKKLIFGFVAVIVASTIVISVGITSIMGHNLYDKTVSEANQTLSRYVNLVDSNMRLYNYVLGTLNTNLSQLPSKERLNMDFVETMLTALVSNHSEFIDMYYALPSGEAIFGSGWQPPEGYNATERSWYRNAVAASGRTVFAEPYIEMERGDLVVAAVCAYFLDGQVAFVTAIEISMDAIFSEFQSINLGKGSHSFLINTDGQIYFHPDEAYSPDGENFRNIEESLTPLIQVPIRNASYTPFTAKDLGGIENFYFGQRLITMPWTLCISIPSSVFQAGINTSITAAIILVALFTVLAITLGVFAIRRMVIQPVKSVRHIADEMALGNINETIQVDRQDEIGELQKSFLAMQDSIRQQISHLQKVAQGELNIEIPVMSDKDAMGIALRDLVQENHRVFSEIKDSAQVVSDSAQQLSFASQNLAAGSTKQAATIEEFSEAISKIQSQSENSSTLALQTKNVTDQVGTYMRESLQRMSDLTEAMNVMNASSQEIRKVIKVIDDIAFQTNILALNAAVEAARAGAHGKGFAVVADEVRSLAAKSAEAASETAGLIQNSVNNVIRGTELTNQTAESLETVSKLAQENAVDLDRLNAMSQQTTASITEINTGIGQISEVVQSTSATSMESAAFAEEMFTQSNLLNQIVSRFNLHSSSQVSKLSGSKSSAFMLE